MKVRSHNSSFTTLTRDFKQFITQKRTVDGTFATPLPPPPIYLQFSFEHAYAGNRLHDVKQTARQRSAADDVTTPRGSGKNSTPGVTSSQWAEQPEVLQLKLLHAGGVKKTYVDGASNAPSCH
jgi:hypothetical protein